MMEAEAGARFGSIPPGAFARFNGSPYYMTKVPDLIGIRDRKYIDHTGPHRLRGGGRDEGRGAGVLLRPRRFRTHRILTDAQRKIFYRMPDDLMFVWPNTSFRSNRRRIQTRVIHALPPDVQYFRGKAARAAMCRRSTPTTSSRPLRATSRRLITRTVPT